MTKFSDDREAAAKPDRDPVRAVQPTHVASRETSGTAVSTALAVLVKAFDDAMPSALERAEVSLAKPEAQEKLPKIAALGLWSPQTFAITELFGGFCQDWVKYRAMIVKAKWVIRLVAGKQVAAAIMGVLAMVDGVHKQACPVKGEE